MYLQVVPLKVPFLCKSLVHHEEFSTSLKNPYSHSVLSMQSLPSGKMTAISMSLIIIFGTNLSDKVLSRQIAPISINYSAIYL
jgi:hypothetical protein